MKKNLLIKFLITIIFGILLLIASILTIRYCFIKEMDSDIKNLIVSICSGFITGLIPLFTTEILNYIHSIKQINEKRKNLLLKCSFVLNDLYQNIKLFYYFHFDENKDDFKWKDLITSFKLKPDNIEKQKLMNSREKIIIEKVNELDSELKILLDKDCSEFFSKKEYASLNEMLCYCKAVNQLNIDCCKQTMLKSLENIYQHANRIKELRNYYIKPKLSFCSTINKEIK